MSTQHMNDTDKTPPLSALIHSLHRRIARDSNQHASVQKTLNTQLVSNLPCYRRAAVVCCAAAEGEGTCAVLPSSCVPGWATGEGGEQKTPLVEAIFTRENFGIHCPLRLSLSSPSPSFPSNLSARNLLRVGASWASSGVHSVLISGRFETLQKYQCFHISSHKKILGTIH